MGITVFPLNDELYSAEDFRTYTAPASTGLYAGEGHFEATTDENTLTIQTGRAWMKFDKLSGGSFSVLEPIALEVPDIMGQQVARLFFTADTFQNKYSAAFRVGENENDPNIQPVRNSTVCEVAPYDVVIDGGLYKLVDNRLNETLCGLMKSEVESIPTQQIVDDANALLETLRAAYDGIVTREGLMLILDYDPAGVRGDAFLAGNHRLTGYIKPSTGTPVTAADNVRDAIGKVEARANEAVASGTNATATIAGGVLAVTSLFPHLQTEYDVRFTMPAGAFTSVSIDGVAMTGVLDTTGDEAAFEPAPGVPVTLTRQGDRAFFKDGPDRIFNKALYGSVFIDDTERQVGWYMTGTNGSGERLYKPWYESRMDIANLPNSQTGTYQHGIANVEHIEFKKIILDSSDGTGVLPLVSIGASTNQVNPRRLTATSFQLEVGSDRRSYSATCYFNYTKTTDAAKTEAEILAGR